MFPYLAVLVLATDVGGSFGSSFSARSGAVSAICSTLRDESEGNHERERDVVEFSRRTVEIGKRVVFFFATTVTVGLGTYTWTHDAP